MRQLQCAETLSHASDVLKGGTEYCDGRHDTCISAPDPRSPEQIRVRFWCAKLS